MDEKNFSIDTKAPESLRAELADTRAQMGNTIEALHGRLNPTVLKEQALDSFHEVKATITEELKQHLTDAKAAMKIEFAEVAASLRSEVKAEYEQAKEKVSEELQNAKQKVSEEISEAKHAMREATIGKVEHMVQNAHDTVVDTKNSMIDTIKANPIPSALIGAGVAWMLFGRKSSRSASRPQLVEGMQNRSIYEEGNRGLLETVGATASKAGHSVSSAVSGAAHQVGDFATHSGQSVVAFTHDAVDSVGRVAHAASDRTAQLAHRVGDGSAAIARATKDGAVDLQRRTANGYRSNPMAFGAAVLAVGAAIGLAIPASRREDEVMGAVRDGLLEKAENMAHDALEKVEDAAKDFTDTTMKAVNDEKAAMNQHGNAGKDTRSTASAGTGNDSKMGRPTEAKTEVVPAAKSENATKSVGNPHV